VLWLVAVCCYVMGVSSGCVCGVVCVTGGRLLTCCVVTWVLHFSVAFIVVGCFWCVVAGCCSYVL